MFLLCFRCRVASRLEHFMNQFFILFGKFDYCHPLYSSAQKKSMYVSNDRTDDKLKKVKIAFFACIVIALLAVPLGV